MKVSEIITPSRLDEGFFNGASAIMELGKVLGIGKVVFDYFKEAQVLDKQLAAKQISKEQYDAAIKKQRDVISAQLVVVLASGTLITIFSTMLRVTNFLPGGIGRLISAVITLGSGTISTIIIGYVSTDAGRREFADLVTSGMFTGINETIINMAKTFIDAAKNWYNMGKDAINGTHTTPTTSDGGTVKQSTGGDAEYERYGYTKNTPSGKPLAFNTDVPTGYTGPLY